MILLCSFDIILMWNRIFSKLPFGLRFGSTTFLRPQQCFSRYPRCLLTANKKYLDMARSVVVHWPLNRFKGMPDRPSNDHQLWTLYTMESPSRSFHSKSFKFHFNLTASYQTDSDIHVPYGRVYQRKWPLNDDDGRVRVPMKRKRKMIAWFVSNCKTKGGRENYVYELNKTVSVDVYGGCGVLKCESNRNLTSTCYHMIEREYYFYLAFENSLCK